MRLRLVCQRTAIWADKWDAGAWIRSGQLLTPQPTSDQPPDPAELVAREQIRRDGGRFIVENVLRAIEEWQVKTSKPAGLT